MCGFIQHGKKVGLPQLALPVTRRDTCHLMHFFNSTHEHCICPSALQTEQLCYDQLDTNYYSCKNAPNPLTLTMVPKSFQRRIRSLDLHKFECVLFGLSIVIVISFVITCLKCFCKLLITRFA